MGWRLSTPDDAIREGHIKRFDPRFWTVNFPRPMMATVTTPPIGHGALTVDAVFYRANDLAGLIWEAEDQWDHPLLSYETSRDFRGCVLSFHWNATGLMPLDAVNGPTLTIEGRDAEGNPRAWYVRLWNYATGGTSFADVRLDFDDLDGGFLLPGEADPVWAGDIDRLFLSLVPPGYTGVDTPLAVPAEASVEITDIRCEGPGSTLAIGDILVPAHGLRIATGFDDSYNVTPARLLRNALHLGYRGVINHYVGMSHYFRLGWNAGAGKFLVSLTGGALNPPTIAWHHDFASRAARLGYGLIQSLSYELFDAHCWNDWKQRAEDGAPALTGWDPPSALLSPASSAAMSYLQAVGRAFALLADGAGHDLVRFQIGEPWWWTMSDGRPCLYDAAAVVAFGGDPVSIPDVRGALTSEQTDLLDDAGALLAASTGALRDAVRDAVPGAEVLLLVYLPTVLDAAAPELKRANVPVGWASPAYDVLQLEDYDWVIGGNWGATARGIAATTARLGYPLPEQHYFSGFILNREAAPLWAEIDAAAEAGRARGSAETFIWALPQVIRDGFVHFDQEEGAVEAFDDVNFPIALGQDALVEPGFSTTIVTTASGHEQRNADWAEARMRFDAGPGVRSEADVQSLIAFFRARRGAAKGFRFRDPFDDSSNAMTGTPAPGDQTIGTGDGMRTEFPLVKRYGTGDEAMVRRVTRPVAGGVRVARNGVEAMSGWTIAPGGIVTFETPPAVGVSVTAGFRFDVPVRFAEDRLAVSRATYLAGEVASVPLIEIREV